MFKNKNNLFNKTKILLSSAQRKEFINFIPLFLLVMIFETIGLSLIVLILNMLSENSLNNNFLSFFKFLNIEKKSLNELFTLSILTLLIVYTVKTLFLTYVPGI